MDNDNYCVLKKLPSDNTLILQIGCNTYVDNWMFDPLTLCVLFNAATWQYVQYPFILDTALRIRWFWSYSWQHESKSTLSSHNRSRESLILQTFDPELLLRMFTFPFVSTSLFSRVNDAKAGWIFYSSSQGFNIWQQ